MSNYFMMQYRINLTSHLSNCAVGPGQPPLQKTQILPERSSEPMQCEALTTTSTGTCPNCPVGPHQPRAPLHVQDISGLSLSLQVAGRRWVLAVAGAFRHVSAKMGAGMVLTRAGPYVRIAGIPPFQVWTCSFQCGPNGVRRLRREVALGVAAADVVWESRGLK
jgi:hypothetical protein